MEYVFISYSNADHLWCERFYRDLTHSLGPRVFLSANVNPDGIAFEPFMWDIFSKSYAIPVIVSSNSTHSAWVKREAAEALKRKELGASLLIIPVLIGDIESARRAAPQINEKLAQFHYADFTSGADYQTALRRLVYVLKNPKVVRQISLTNGPLVDMGDLRPWWMRALEVVKAWALWFGNG